MPVVCGGSGRAPRSCVENGALERRGGLHFLTPDQAALLLIPNPASTPALLDIVRPMLDGSGP